MLRLVLENLFERHAEDISDLESEFEAGRVLGSFNCDDRLKRNLRMLFLMDVGAMSKTTSVIKQPSNRHRHFSDNEEQEQYDGN